MGPWDKQFSIRLSTCDGKSTQTWEMRVKMGWAGTNPTPKNAMGNTLGGLKYISHDPIAADFSWSALGARFSIAVPFHVHNTFLGPCEIVVLNATFFRDPINSHPREFFPLFCPFGNGRS